MDPFLFDQRFARFVGQVDSAAASKGTELFESGAVRVDSLGKSLISGWVEERREGRFRVKLALNDEGGFSGSCSCPEVFNCCHSYALARQARLQVVGSFGGQTNRASSTADVRSPETKEIDRIWGLAKRSGNLLYPRDLLNIVANRTDLGPVSREPFRDLKRVLQRENPSSSGAFSEVLFQYLRHKGIAVADAYSKFGETTSKTRAFEKPTERRDWDRPPLKLRVRFELEESPDRDWFQARAVWEVEGMALQASEIDQLRSADGALVRLEGKGWYRLDGELASENRRALDALGLDPERGNSQRIHLSQIEDLLSEEMLGQKEWQVFQDKGRRIKAQSLPSPPAPLSSVLRPYQIAGFQFLCRMSEWQFGGILADDMGLGKTVQALAWLLHLSHLKGKGFRALVICPKSVTDNWVQEPNKFNTGLVARRFDGKVGIDPTSHIVVANYAQLRIKSEAFLSEDWDAVILDEAQYIKSPSSQTSKVAYKLKGKHRLAMTGTPVENSLTDLWSLMRFAMPRLFGPLPTFRANYSSQRADDNLLALRNRMKPFFLRRLKTEVAKDLPERIEKDIYCDLEGEQRALYEAQLAEARSLLNSAKKGGRGGSLNVLQALLRLRQTCCDPRLLRADRGAEKTESAKLQALLDLVEPLVAEGHKVLVFSQFTKMLDLAELEFGSRGISYLKLTGQTRDRAKLVDRFQNGGNESIFLLSLKAAGSGLTLTAASYVVLLDPWWNPAVEAQAIDRAHRIGQKDQVIAYRILAKDTVEEKIRRIQDEKAELAAAVFGEGAKSTKFELSELEAFLD
ncbi:DEAD/DEAH box helicase [Pelagicoccus albus]|uniref:DEAD/DEAH box helicase n=1 Tax=Pelagicoccus albus TaxID=415222 RepID=A0A7X1E8Z9_9BACT|nr:DEAD/DEAH box helicase [Pelagicoccus albus]MBC2605302.1 DEAD/DEAH box helicase [Pelagicoccus albus]